MRTQISWKKLSRWLSVKPKTTAYIVFVVLQIITLYILVQRYEFAKETKRNIMNTDLNAIQENIEQTLKNCYTTTLSLALTIDDNGVPRDFETIGAQLLASNNDIVAVQLVPDGIIKYTYPLKGNEKAVGLDILKSELLRDEALASILKRKMYFAGPIELIQGGQGIVGRLPVYNNNRFWGFSAVILKLDTLLENSIINSSNGSAYYFQLSKIDPLTNEEVFFLKQRKELIDNDFVSTIITDGDWKLYLIDKHPNSLFPPLVIPWLLGLLLSLWFAYLTYILVKKPAELEIFIKQQATKLFKSELQFKTIFEQAEIGIAVVEIETGRFLEINNHFCAILGYTENELKGMTFKEVTFQDDLQNDLKQLKKVNSGIIDSYSLEKRYLTKKGEIVWVALTVSPLWNEEKKHISNIAFAQNITARKSNEALIASSQKRIESLINTIDGIVWETDAEVNFTFISKKVESILGYTSDEWISSKDFWLKHIHPDDKEFVLNYCSVQTAANLDHDFEYRMIAKNGDVIWLRDIVNLGMDSNGKLINMRGIMIDITKPKEIEYELNKSLSLVTEQNKRLLNFSYIVSHNLRSHTSNITSLINLIETSDSKEEVDHMIQLLKTVSTSLNETMLNLNEVVNIQTNVGLIQEKLNLNEIIKNTLQVLSQQIKEKEIIVQNNIDANTIINYNPAYLESILYNLFSNAIRYSSPERKPMFSISLLQDGENKILQITDNGIGIDLEQNGNKIFGMYKTFTNHKDSKGIGLFITKNQIEAMGGTVMIESELNQGTTFKIIII
ncbi:MAG: PAS domain S-box protein [Bacteroidetes bacterium]|nr:PAS domain S-box protein [Bacteroidota bacterium]